MGESNQLKCVKAISQYQQAFAELLTNKKLKTN